MANCDELLTSNWGHTWSTLIKTTFKWSINHFSRRTEKLDSPPFFSGPNDQETWHLELSPTDINGWHSLSLCLDKSNKGPVTANYKLCIINGKLQNVCCQGAHNKLFSTGTRMVVHGLQRLDLFDKERLLLPNDTLTFYCQLSYLSGAKSTSGKFLMADKPASDSANMEEDFRSIFESTELSDFTLAVKDKEVKAHKIILAARSPVFKAMFIHEMAEAQKSRVEITDVSYEDLKEMIHFIYTGRISAPGNITVYLLAAADKYDVKGLKSTCEKYMVFDVDSAARILLWADRHSAHTLKERCVNFISQNADKVGQSSGWKELLACGIHLLGEFDPVFLNELMSPKKAKTK